MAKRREFTPLQREEITDRSRNAAGQICCEGCGQVLGHKKHEIDHIIAEALRPAEDKKRPLTVAEGQLLGKDCCHRGENGKTNKDVKAIAEAKRRYAKHNGMKRPAAKPIRSAPFPQSEKAAKRMEKPMPQRRPLFIEKDSRP